MSRISVLTCHGRAHHVLLRLVRWTVAKPFVHGHSGNDTKLTGVVIALLSSLPMYFERAAVTWGSVDRHLYSSGLSATAVALRVGRLGFFGAVT
jgi:hypothetical protein